MSEIKIFNRYYDKELASIVILSLILLILMIVISAFFSYYHYCSKSEDLCYHEECVFFGKGYSCTDKPVSCSANDVKGHKQFCSQYSWRFFD